MSLGSGYVTGMLGLLSTSALMQHTHVFEREEVETPCEACGCASTIKAVDHIRINPREFKILRLRIKREEEGLAKNRRQVAIDTAFNARLFASLWN